MISEIAIIEDDATLREELVFLFEDAGYRVHQALNHDGLLDILRLNTIHLIILDLGLPGMTGYQIAEQLRQTQPAIGIIMLTARARSEDRVRGYGAGADIYLTKPADPQELLAAVASLGRRVTAQGSAPRLTLECRRGCLRVNAEDASARVELTAAELFILRALALAPEQVLESGELLDLLAEKFPEASATRRSLENRISRLRGKASETLAADLNLIRPIRGVGYQLSEPLQLLD